MLPAVPPECEAAVARATADVDNIDIPALIHALPCVSLRQVAAVPGSIVRMNFGCIHRGVHNENPPGHTRLVFWVSVARNGYVVPIEPLITDFEVDKDLAVTHPPTADAEITI